MLRMLNRLILCLAVSCLATPAADAGLVGQWPFDGNLDDVVGTANGTFSGGSPTYQKGQVKQAIWFDGVDDYVDIPSPTNPSVYSIAAWVKPARTSAAGIITRTDASGPTTSWSHQLRINTSGQFHHYLWVGAERNISGTTVIVPDTWYHVVIVAENNGPMRLYVNGVEEGTSISTAGTLWATGTRILVGSNSGHSMGWFQGLVDDVQIFDHALTASEIPGLMKNKALAQDPVPEDGAIDVHRDAVMSWAPGEYAVAHDVYFGTVFEDVNTAGRTDPKGVLASQNQADASFDPEGLLSYGQTYFWRIDEINAAPDGTIFKGETWSFTAEPFSYPVTPAVATAASAQAGMGPENTINGLGLNANDEHSTELTSMWMSTGAQPNWIQYEFDKVYKLDKLLVWNSNQLIETFLGFGARDVTIEYSSDGQTWTALEGVPEFARATATPTYKANTTVDFGGAMAQFVKLTIARNWGGVAPQSGLSEVRFFAVPVQAFEPQPAVAATDVSIDTDLTWRPGREAESHEVYLGTDENALAQVATGAEHSYTPVSLNLATTYFWKVNEIGGGGPYEGEVWSFTTEEYAVVDDMESYNDDDNRIYDAWIDGLTDPARGGSQVGYDMSPFAEKTVIYGGIQSLPLIYSNSASSVSEAQRAFDSPQNWTARGIKTLAIHFAGVAGNGGNLYVKINNTKVACDGDPADLARTAWQAWNIDLSQAGNVSSVRTLTIGIEGAGAAGTLYIDEIRLYPKAPEFITPTDPGNQGLVAHYAFNSDLKDSSGNGLHGTFVDGAPQWIAGHVGQALQFNGTDGYVDLGTNEAMNLTQAITVACWLKDEGYTRGWQAIFTKGLGWRLQRNGTQATLEWTCPPSPYLFSKGTVDDGEWHHLVGTYDGQRQALYIDGMLDVEQAVSGPMGATQYRVMIGCIDTLTDRVWNGPIDDARLYDRALSIAEILWLADLTTPRHKPF